MITAGQIKCIKVLFGKLNIEHQDALVLGHSPYSGGKVSQMGGKEATELIRYLKSQDPEEKKAEVMRRKLLALAHQIKWEVDGGKVDMKRVDAWCKKYGHKKKALNAYTYAELPMLVSQFEENVKHVLKTV